MRPPTEAERARYLDRAIEAYEEGTFLDLNDFYQTSNLPASTVHEAGMVMSGRRWSQPGWRRPPANGASTCARTTSGPGRLCLARRSTAAPSSKR
jgi:hypothetical protein